nr:MAG TPA: hypothetical protein [Caudoviricetes sp.]
MFVPFFSSFLFVFYNYYYKDYFVNVNVFFKIFQ